jgi:hypothetical protein
MAGDPKQVPGLVPVAIIENDCEIVRLDYVGVADSAIILKPEFTGIDAARFSNTLFDNDSRDLPWHVRLSNGLSVPFCTMDLGFDPPTQTVVSRYPPGTFCQAPESNWWQQLLGMKPPDVPLERRPFVWRKPRHRRVRRLLRSGLPDEIATGLRELAATCTETRSPSALQEFVKFARHLDPQVRSDSLEGIGEIARRFGVSDSASRAALAAATSDPEIAVRRAAARAQKTLRLFISQQRNDAT